MNVKSKRALKITLLALFVIFIGLLVLFLFSGENSEILIKVFTEDMTRDEIQDALRNFGMRGYITIALLAMIQVIMTFVPAEPVQVLGGVAFGFLRGLVAYMVGMIIANTIIFVLYKIYGTRLNRFFENNLDLDLERVSGSGRIMLVIFLLYFLPAIPYGMICFFAASMRIKYPRYILVTTLSAIPSACIGVGLGHIAMSTGWIVTIIMLAVIVILFTLFIIKRRAIMKWVNDIIHRASEPHTTKTKVKKSPKFFLAIADFVARVIYFFKGVKLKLKNNVGKIKGPAIVLCNHGAFSDFVYSGMLLRKSGPNFITARLYFCHRWFARLLRTFGCFPKSMFSLDIESIKNCRRVINRGGVLAMMPEARLSTAGRFEDIQPSTYSFIKQMGVDVYFIKISGDYLASPKWGNGMRRGAYVEAELSPLFKKEELEALTPDAIGERIENALYYDELNWLDTMPKVRYKSKTIAEGLENILAVCPHCKGRYTLMTKGNRLYCEKCELSLTVSDRYLFVEDDAPFKHFTDWFNWQVDLVRDEVLADPEFALTDKVTLKHPSIDGKTLLRTVGEGECTLSREGLVYRGTINGENVEKRFPMDKIYRLLFGAGENFEIYEGQTIYYFVPTDTRSAVMWYIVSKNLKDNTDKG